MATARKILIVDDEADALENCRRILSRLEYDCLTETDGTRALEVLRRERPGLVLTDLRMPGMDGMELLEAAKALDARVRVVLMTAYASIDTAIGSMRGGAVDYLPKPFTSRDLEQVARRAFEGMTELQRVPAPVPVLREAPSQPILGNSPAMREVLRLVHKVAPTQAGVLIYGESGTGKELIAREIHARSIRADRPFMPVDCASLSDTLLESELFGHEKGAFTGAHASKRGLFEVANGGTVFLDEVGAMSPALQARLLRVLQERQVRPVGSTYFMDVDVRVVAASNRDLEDACRRGDFREDLYYRLNVIQIALPPLRVREGDVPLLAEAFLAGLPRFNEEPVRFSAEALEILTRYRWPGNVRELRNVVERAAALAEGALIGPEHLPAPLRALPPLAFKGSGADYKSAKRHMIRSFERHYLVELLHRHHGHMSRAAREAGVDRKTIERMVKKHGLRVRREPA